MSFRIDPTKALKGLVEAELKAKAKIGLYCDAAGKKLESEAKENAPWTDRTGDARKTIQGGKEWEGDKCIAYIAGNKDYSEYLEFANEKKHAVLWPTVNKMQDEIIKGMKNIIE